MHRRLLVPIEDRRQPRPECRAALCSNHGARHAERHPDVARRATTPNRCSGKFTTQYAPCESCGRLAARRHRQLIGYNLCRCHPNRKAIQTPSFHKSQRRAFLHNTPARTAWLTAAGSVVRAPPATPNQNAQAKGTRIEFLPIVRALCCRS